LQKTEKRHRTIFKESVNNHKTEGPTDKNGMNTMELSIKQISEGGTFMADFKKVVVERCHYVNAVDERVEKTDILSNQ